jgi:hypothetical protein
MKPSLRSCPVVGASQSGNFDQRLSRPGNDEGIPLHGLLYQARQLRFGFVNIDPMHSYAHSA